jgi:hypothetical protein
MTLDDKNSQKIANIFFCEKCDYKCSKLFDYKKHISTRKHTKDDKMITKDDKKSPKIAKEPFSCECGKIYKHRQGLWKHKQVCNNKEVTNKSELINYLIKENSELKQMIIDVCKNTTQQTTNANYNNTTISTNKTFNLQFFLNETCKNAMNIMDFIDSIQLQLSDLEKVGEIGYIEGISNIITSNLQALDITQRPIHCTDKKREVLYIKDKEKWEKENDDKNMLRKAIKSVTIKNQRLLPKFKEVHPDCGKSDSAFSDQYNNIIIESMGGKGDNNKEKENKIIKNILHVTTINKDIKNLL